MSDYRTLGCARLGLTPNISLSASKAMTIFTILCEKGEPCSLADIVRATDYPRTVANRMLATLVHHGFVARQHDTGLYSVDPRALHLVNKALDSDPLLNRVELIMREVVNHTKDPALFMIRSGRHALVISRREGTSTIRVHGSRVGMSLPLHCGGAPMVLLANSDDSFIDEYLAGPLEARTRHTCTDPGLLRERIAGIRESGCSVSCEDLFEYVVAIGAPVFDSAGQLAGAISVGSITQRYPPERIEEVKQILFDAIRRFQA